MAANSVRPGPGARPAAEDVDPLLGWRRDALSAFVRRQRRRVALVPSRGVIFAILGDPLEQPELTWLAPGGEYRFRDLARERGLSEPDAGVALNRLRAAFRSHASTPRHAVAIGGRQVEVISSGRLAAEIRKVVSEVLT